MVAADKNSCETSRTCAVVATLFSFENFCIGSYGFTLRGEIEIHMYVWLYCSYEATVVPHEY